MIHSITFCISFKDKGKEHTVENLNVFGILTGRTVAIIISFTLTAMKTVLDLLNIK